MAESAAAIAYAAWRDWRQPESVGTTYVCSDTERNHRIVARLRRSVGHYCPPALWSYNPHIASILSAAAAPSVEYTRQTICAAAAADTDVDDVHIDWWPRVPRRDDGAATAIVLLFPGLGAGSSDSAPRAFAATVANAGHLCGVVNPTRKWLPTRTKEAERVLAAAADEWGAAARLMVVGMSGSTTILSHVLPRAPPQQLPQLGAVLCCFVTDYGTSLDRLETGSAEGRAYSRLLAARLRALMAGEAAALDCAEGCLLSELNAAVARNLFGSVAALRSAQQTSPLLARIPVPCLLVQPTDDPLHTLSDPIQQRESARAAVAANANLVLVEPTHGAHLGFCSGAQMGKEKEEEAYHPAQLALALLDEMQQKKKRY